MNTSWQKLKIYLNEDTTAYREPRYKIIRLFLIGLIFFGSPIFLFFHFFNRDILKPILSQQNSIKVQYNEILFPIAGILLCLCVIWMFSFNLAVRGFASNKWTKYCYTKPRPYFNYFIYHFSTDYKKNIVTDAYFFFFSLLFCLIIIILPQSFQVNVDTKIMSHYGYYLCRSYIDNDDNKLKLIFVKNGNTCIN